MYVWVGVSACCVLRVGGWVSMWRGEGGSIVVQFYLGGNVLEKFAICLLQCFFQ